MGDLNEQLQTSKLQASRVAVDRDSAQKQIQGFQFDIAEQDKQIEQFESVIQSLKTQVSFIVLRKGCSKKLIPYEFNI